MDALTLAHAVTNTIDDQRLHADQLELQLPPALFEDTGRPDRVAGIPVRMVPDATGWQLAPKTRGAVMTDPQRNTWFAAPDRPVGGNTAWIRPAVEPRYWGSNPSPELDRLVALFHRALFREDETYGPEFRSASSPRALFADDDLLLATAADQMAFAVLDHADEIAALVAAIREQAT